MKTIIAIAIAFATGYLVSSRNSTDQGQPAPAIVAQVATPAPATPAPGAWMNDGSTRSALSAPAHSKTKGPGAARIYQATPLPYSQR